MSFVEVMNIATVVMELTAVDIAGIYSPPRFSERAAEFKLRLGFSVDFSTTKPSGGPEDLNRNEDVAELEKPQAEQKPALLIASAPCEFFPSLLDIELSADGREAKKVIGRRP